MKVTIKGQVTIPQDIREKHGFWPETEGELVERNGRVVLEKRQGGESRGRRVVRRIEGTADVGMTKDQIMRLTRGE